MKKIVVIGAGTMGLDIAQVFAKSGFDVVVRDVSDEAVRLAEQRLHKALGRQVEKGKMSAEQRQAIIGNMRFTSDVSLAQDADLVVEAAVEDLALKQQIFAELDRLCKPSAIFATNTSSISITAIASITKRPAQCIGMHFFNPATVMQLVEVIRASHTSDATFAAVYALAQSIGKVPVTVEEAPGFVVNKLLIPMINEAAELVYTGVASAEDVDKAMKLGANHPIGPLALGDLIGLDVCLAILDTLYAETGSAKYAASLLLRKKVRAGELGRKTGKGFFVY